MPRLSEGVLPAGQDEAAPEAGPRLHHSQARGRGRGCPGQPASLSLESFPQLAGRPGRAGQQAGRSEGLRARRVQADESDRQSHGQPQESGRPGSQLIQGETSLEPPGSLLMI